MVSFMYGLQLSADEISALKRWLLYDHITDTEMRGVIMNKVVELDRRANKPVQIEIKALIPETTNGTEVLRENPAASGGVAD